MSWWESELSDFEWVNVFTNVAYAAFGILSGDPLFGTAMCWLAIGSGLFHAKRTKVATAIDHSGVYGAMGTLPVPY